jgi:hypothetical protein
VLFDLSRGCRNRRDARADGHHADHHLQLIGLMRGVWDKARRAAGLPERHHGILGTASRGDQNERLVLEAGERDARLGVRRCFNGSAITSASPISTSLFSMRSLTGGRTNPTSSPPSRSQSSCNATESVLDLVISRRRTGGLIGTSPLDGRRDENRRADDRRGEKVRGERG